MQESQDEGLKQDAADALYFYDVSYKRDHGRRRCLK